MDCARCQQKMMAETVITLRRSVFGVRETRRQGGYCATCRRSAVQPEAPARTGRARLLCAGIARSVTEALHAPVRTQQTACLSP